MNDVLTKKEREAIEEIRRRKWNRVYETDSVLPGFMKLLNAAFTSTVKTSTGRIVREQHYDRGCNARITHYETGGEIIIGDGKQYGETRRYIERRHAKAAGVKPDKINPHRS